MMTRGAVWVHSAPAVLCPHIDWALSAASGEIVRLDWTAQPAEPGTMRADYTWTGPVGTGAKLASALRGCGRARFEVTEDPSDGDDGMRWSYTPSLGVHATAMGAHGDVFVDEQRLRKAMADDVSGRHSLASALADLIGMPWDAELEPFRQASEGAAVRWLHRVG